MSTYYHLHCIDHDTRSESLGNRVDDSVRHAVALWPDIVALERKADELGAVYGVRYHDIRVDADHMAFWAFRDFMRAHAHCKLDLEDEYGRVHSLEPRKPDSR